MANNIARVSRPLDIANAIMTTTTTTTGWDGMLAVSVILSRYFYVWIDYPFAGVGGGGMTSSYHFSLHHHSATTITYHCLIFSICFGSVGCMYVLCTPYTIGEGGGEENNGSRRISTSSKPKRERGE